MKNVVFWNVTFCVALVRRDVSEEVSASIIRTTRIGELVRLNLSPTRYTEGPCQCRPVERVTPGETLVSERNYRRPYGRLVQA
jgi:hypothetical protein